jgi:3-oxoacyl-[acyl-carrier protein] reductase
VGKSIALRLADDGWTVAIHGSQPNQECERVVKALGKHGCGPYCADLTDPRNATDLFKRVAADGEVHALVNNAGVYLPLDFLASGEAAFTANLHRSFAVNFESPLRLMRAATRYFAKQGGGKILNVASRVGFKGEAGAALYAASKAALINLTRSLAIELAPRNIGLFGLAPGWVDTAMARAGMESRLDAILDAIPMGRMATPEDCAATAAFLLSDDAAYLSGVVIDVNGASYFH